MRCAFVAAFAAVLACGASPIDVQVDGTFSDRERADLERAAARWADFCGAPVFALTERKAEWLIVESSLPGDYKGFASRRRRLIRIDRERSGPQFYAVAIHEFGHVLGMQHVRNGVMAPGGGATEWSDEDRAEADAAGACP